MTELGKLHIRELAAFICDALRREGLEVTLSGGACAEIYSASRYVTGDLDFVTNYIGVDMKNIEKWSKAKGMAGKYAEFLKRLSQPRPHKSCPCLSTVQVSPAPI